MGKKSWHIEGLFLLIIVAFAVFASIRLEALNIKPAAEQDLWRLLGILFLLALLVERALEVFMTALRAPKAENLQAKVDALATKPGDKETMPLLNTEDLKDPRNKLLAYKQDTRHLALFLGLAAGVAISALGFRFIESLLDISKLDENSFQFYGLRFMDIFITGGLIAGGSDGVHKLTEAYSSFTETYVREKNKTA